MTRPILIDLFCAGGGASVGYSRAGFDVVGIDRDPQPDYPLPFRRDNVFNVLSRLLSGDALRIDNTWIPLEHVAAFGASPMCWHHTALTKGNRGREGWTDDHVDQIPETRELLEATGKPYVIENVQGSTLRRDLTLCGHRHFGLKVFRHRYFELGGGFSMDPMTCNGRGDHGGQRVAGWRHGVKYAGEMVAVYGDGGGKGSLTDWQAAMGIDWINDKKTLAQAIPPAYTAYIGNHLFQHVKAGGRSVSTI